MKKKSPALLFLFCAAASGGLGYFVGRLPGSDAPAPVHAVPVADSLSRAAPQRVDDPGRAGPAGKAGEEAAPSGTTAAESAASLSPFQADDYIKALRANAGTEKGQQIALALVGEAVLRGKEVLPQIQALLDSGIDVPLTGFNGRGPGYPSLRMALLAAAEATGDPAAADLIEKVTQNSQNPVEVIFGAHLLDRMDKLDPQTAHRTLDALASDLTPQQRQEMASVVGPAARAAAKADPAYAENYLAAQIRVTDGPRANLHSLAAVLDGLPPAQAKDFILATVDAGDVQVRTKSVLVRQAAQRQDLAVLQSLRQAVESQNLPPRVEGAMAWGAVTGPAYWQLERDARKSLHAGDLTAAAQSAQAYQARLGEANNILSAVQGKGVRIPAVMTSRVRYTQQRLRTLMNQIAAAQKKAEAAAKKG